MKNGKIIFVLCIINLVLTLFIIFNVRTNELSYNTIKINKKDNLTEKLKNENFVFLGDSITDWYPFDELYEDIMPIINSGRAGYQTKDILEKLPSLVYDYNPTKVFILIGTNDLKDENLTTDNIVNNIKEIIEKIKENRPNAKIYLQSIYPINNTDNEKIDKKDVGIRKNENIKEINKKLKSYCEENQIVYIDMYTNLIDKDGNLDIKYTEDGLHLSSLGYIKVTRILLPYLEN